jgi:hypothetical protein
MDANHPVAQYFVYWLNIFRERHKKENSNESRYDLARHESLMTLWGIPIPFPPF